MKPNTILAKYLMKSFFVAFFAVFFLVIGVVLMFEIIDLLRRVSGRADVGISIVFKMAFSKLPRTIEMVFPFVVMIAGMASFWKLSKSQEYVVTKAAGISIWSFLSPILLSAFVIGFVNIMLINPISSKMYEIHETLDYQLKSRNPDAILFNSKGLWIREAINKEDVMILQAASVRMDDGIIFIKGISIIEMDNIARPIRRLEAYIGELGAGYIDLKDVKIYKQGEATEFVPSLKYNTTINIDRIRENFIEPDAISFWDLPNTIKFYEASGFAVQKHYLRYLSLWASPFLLASMVLIAAMFALRSNTRKGGVMIMIVGGIATGFIVYFMSQVIYAFGVNGYIPAWLSVWAPFFIISSVGVSVILQIEEG